MASISTTALRLAAIESLAPSDFYGDPAAIWPTLVEGRVYDSGAVPFDRSIDEGGPGPGRVQVAVYADEARGAPRGESFGLAPQDLTIDLVFDVEIPVIESGEWGVGETDAAGAALLEVATAQIRRVLAVGATGTVFRRLAKAFGPIEARWSRHPELGVRLARLTMRLPVDIDDDDWSDVIDGLPAPSHRLRPLLPAASYGRAILDRVAATWTAPPDPSPLAQIRFGLGLGAPPATLAGAAIAGAVDLPGD